MSLAPHILIIGNSHVGAPRLAWARKPGRWPCIDPVFLGLPGWDMANLKVQDGVLRPANERIAQQLLRFNDIEQLELHDFDAFAIVGGHSFHHSASFVADHCSPDFPSARSASAGRQLVSRAFLENSLTYRLNLSAAARLCRRLATLGKPVAMVPEPMPSADCRTTPDDYLTYLDLVARGDQPHWRAIYAAARQAVHGDAAHIIDWPEKALVEGSFTRPDLMRGSITLLPDQQERHSKQEFAHANPAYGALVIDQIADTLATL